MAQSADGLQWPEQGVATAPSLIDGAGSGLFARRNFEAGAQVAEYYGQRLSFLKMIQCEETDYVMGGFDLNTYVDARLALDCSGRYINDNFDPAKINAQFDKLPGEHRANVIATKPIAAGEEIFASYGEDYWKPRGIDPLTGEPCELDEETREGLELLAAARARAKKKQTQLRGMSE